MVLAVWGPSRDAFARWAAAGIAATTLALSLNLLFATPPPAQLHPWIPSYGVTWILASDWLSSVLVGWASLATLLTVGATPSDSRTVSALLWMQATVTGLFLARDMFLLFACLGGLTIALASLAVATRKVLLYQLAGLAFLYGWFAKLYGMVYAQTGFFSTELARWQTLALYPEEERALFLWSAVGVVLLLPAFVVALDEAPRAGRLALVATFVVVVTYVLLRIVVPLCAGGAASASGWLLAFALGLMGVGVLGRDWPRIAVGYLGLVCYGLFGFTQSTVVGAVLLMFAAAFGFYGLSLAGTRVSRWAFAVFVIAMPVPCVLVPAWKVSWWWSLVAISLFAALVVRIISVARARSAHREVPEPPIRTLWAVPAMLLSLSLILGWGVWRAHIEPFAEGFVDPPASREGQP